MQFSLFDDDSRGPPTAEKLPLPGADVIYYPRWLNAKQATASFDSLVSSLSWAQDTIKLFGKPVKIPRLQAWHGDITTVYTYSGLTMAPEPWTPSLQALRQRCEQTAGCTFNSVLANWYRNGQDSMGMHADDEPELGPQPVIASLSLGETRPFIFKHKRSKANHRINLEHGSLLLMRGDTQRNYLHGINKTTRDISGRINLTFRYIYPTYPESL